MGKQKRKNAQAWNTLHKTPSGSRGKAEQEKFDKFKWKKFNQENGSSCYESGGVEKRGASVGCRGANGTKESNRAISRMGNSEKRKTEQTQTRKAKLIVEGSRSFCLHLLVCTAHSNGNLRRGGKIQTEKGRRMLARKTNRSGN